MDTEKDINTEKDIVALMELLKMAADQWPRSTTGLVSQSELFRQNQFLLEMWPEACRRTGVGGRDLPAGVNKLWKRGMGRVN